MIVGRDDCVTNPQHLSGAKKSDAEGLGVRVALGRLLLLVAVQDWSANRYRSLKALGNARHCRAMCVRESGSHGSGRRRLHHCVGGICSRARPVAVIHEHARATPRPAPGQPLIGD